MGQVTLKLDKSSEILEPPDQTSNWLGRILWVATHSLSISAALILISPLSHRLPTARSILASRVIWLSEVYFAIPFRYLRDALAKIPPAVSTTFQHGLKLTTNWTFVLATSSFEEITFRYCIQSLLLTQIPRSILHKVAPSQESLIDHKMTKVARVVFTSLLFALVHIVRLGDKPGMLLPQFVAGLYLSYLRECGTSIAELSAIHFVVNAISISIMGGFSPNNLRVG